MARLSGTRTYDSPAARWAGVGPYYAMFPATFADATICQYTTEGDWVLDPFAGRATSLFSAATLGRSALGVEINPVGWVYGRAKLQPADRQDVEYRMQWLAAMAPRYRAEAESLPEFFAHCFSLPVRQFLLAARSLLDWRRRKADWTAMALILIDLHGKRQNSLSNQMRQTKAMSPQYAVRWWMQRGLTPPDRDPAPFMLRKIAWRYAKGRPSLKPTKLYLGDSRTVLSRLKTSLGAHIEPAKLLLTSPPYYGVTNYFYDQWLRLWLLGGPPHPRSAGHECKRKFENKPRYLAMLRSVFENCAPLLAPDAVLYVRTDARPFTREATAQVLAEVFPHKKTRHETPSIPPSTQTGLFNPTLHTRPEMDLVLW